MRLGLVSSPACVITAPGQLFNLAVFRFQAVQECLKGWCAVRKIRRSRRTIPHGAGLRLPTWFTRCGNWIHFGKALNVEHPAASYVARSSGVDSLPNK